jgi:hypothetical protein
MHSEVIIGLVMRFIAALAKYAAFVVGGVTLFLILAPVVGYLPYSDRPGAGWHASFPALGLREFLANARDMLGLGLFLGILFVIPGAVGLLAIRGFERLSRHAWTRRIGAAAIAAATAGYWMLGAGWYIAAGVPLLVIATILGAVAGGWLLASAPRQAAVDAK